MNKEITPKNKCSRCGLDLRSPSKSGNNVIVTELEYEGGGFQKRLNE